MNDIQELPNIEIEVYGRPEHEHPRAAVEGGEANENHAARPTEQVSSEPSSDDFNFQQDQIREDDQKYHANFEVSVPRHSKAKLSKRGRQNLRALGTNPQLILSDERPESPQESSA